jgi:hypothetical protein
MELKDVNLEELEKRYKSERNGKIKELDSILDTPYTMENEYTRGGQTKDVQILIKSKQLFVPLTIHL